MKAAFEKTSIRVAVVSLGLLFTLTPGPFASPGAVDSLLTVGSFAAADSMATTHLADMETRFGSGDLRYAQALFDLAKVRVEQDRLEEADELLGTLILAIDRRPAKDQQRPGTAVPMADGDPGKGDDLLANIYILRARIAVSLGRHTDAQPLFKKSLEIKTSHWGADHPECVPALTGLAAIALISGDFAKAEALYLRALNIAGTAYNRAHPWMIDAAIGLATTQGYRGDYLAAEKTLRPHLEAVVPAREGQNSQTIRLMLALADVLATLGQDVESTLMYRRAAALAEAFYGPDHSATAKALSGLAHTRRRAGQGLEARTLYRRCIEIAETRHGSPHPDLVHYRSRLGMSLFEGGRWSEEAEASIERAISEAAALYGEKSYQAALEERHLGLLLIGQFRWKDASAVFESCLPTLEDYFGPVHPFLSKSLKGIAWAYLHLGRSDEALEYAQRMVSLEDAAAGRDEFELVTLLNMKAMIELDARGYDAAVASAQRATRTAIAVQEEHLKISSNQEAILYAIRPWSSAQGLVTAAAAHPALSDADWGNVFSLAVRTHGSVLDWQTERRRLLETYPRDPGAEPSITAAQAAIEHLADLVVNGPVADTTSYFEELARTRRDVEEAERAFSAATEEWRKTSDFVRIHQAISRESLAGALDPGITLIHFLTFLRVTDSPSNTPYWRRTHYAAFRLSKTNDDAHTLDFIDLGPASSLDSLIVEYRAAIDGIPSGHRPSARDEAGYRRSARALYDRIWAPLFPDSTSQSNSLSDGDHTASHTKPPLVLIVPDARLHQLDFNTLLSPAGNLVIERWKTHLLSSGADLLKTPNRDMAGKNMLAAGNPDRTTTGSLIITTDDSTSAPSEHFFCVDASTIVAPLPGAEEEVAMVAALFSNATGESTTVLAGVQATETRVKQDIPGKRIVHLATHGFVCDEKSVGSYAPEKGPIDPLLMTGLIFSPVPGKDDGLLTAQEVTCLDLRTVDWVVLSACGSGLGKVAWGEGMFGLRRAFEIAGARTVVMALWRLDDKDTRRLMEQIYARKIAGASTVDAIREAQLARLAESRRRLNRLHPALWGGIVAEGDWR